MMIFMIENPAIAIGQFQLQFLRGSELTRTNSDGNFMKCLQRTDMLLHTVWSKKSGSSCPIEF